MDKTEVKNLLARALSYIEDVGSLTDGEADDLVVDLQEAVDNLED